MNRYVLENQIEELLSKPPGTFSKEDSSRADVMLRYLDRADHGNGAMPRKRTHEMRDFFASHKKEMRDMITTTGGPQGTITGTGAFVPTGFHAEVFSALKAYDGLFDAATWISSRTGAKFSLPNFYDADTKATKVTEADQSTQADVDPVSALVLDAADTWRSGLIRFSWELIQDQAVNLDAEFAKAFAIRFSRGIGAEFVSNLTSVATTGVTTASSSAATADEFIEMLGAVDPAYGANGTWCMNWTTLTKAWQLKNTNSTYYFPAQFDAEGYPLLAGRRVYVCPNFDDFGADKKVASYGDHSRFIAREVAGSFQVKQLVELYAEYGQNAVSALWRVNGGLLVAGGAGSGDAPVKLLVCHS